MSNVKSKTLGLTILMKKKKTKKKKEGKSEGSRERMIVFVC